MVDLTGQILPYKVIFLLHFIFTSISAMGHWPGNGYLFYNFVLILLILWQLHQSQQATGSPEPLQLALIVNVCSIVFDVIFLAFCYPDSYRAAEKFSVAIAILHLIARPFTVIYMLKIMRERGDEPSIFGNIFPQTQRTTSYEDIDRNQVPHGSQNYDFSPTQQV